VHGLPSDFDPSVFNGATLHQIAFSSSMIDFLFERDPSSKSVDRELSLKALGPFRHDGEDKAGERFSDAVEELVELKESRLMYLLQQRVTATRIEDRADLILQFENGHVLHMIEDPAPYEAYHIEIGDRLIVV
jgi:hypothetical protein